MQLYRAEKLLWHWLFCPRVGMCLHCFQYDIYTTFTKPKKQLDSSYLWMRLQSPKSSQYDWHLSLIFCLCAGSKVAAASFADCASASNTQSVCWDLRFGPNNLDVSLSGAFFVIVQSQNSFPTSMEVKAHIRDNQKNLITHPWRKILYWNNDETKLRYMFCDC